MHACRYAERMPNRSRNRGAGRRTRQRDKRGPSFNQGFHPDEAEAPSVYKDVHMDTAALHPQGQAGRPAQQVKKLAGTGVLLERYCHFSAVNLGSKASV